MLLKQQSHALMGNRKEVVYNSEATWNGPATQQGCVAGPQQGCGPQQDHSGPQQGCVAGAGAGRCYGQCFWKTKAADRAIIAV